MIQALAEFSKPNASHVKGILNLTIPLNKSPVWILGQYLWQLGLSTDSRRPMEDGQRVRYYRLNTSDVEFIQKVLDYRQRQREDRERKRHQEQERHATYAAIMQSQYGVEQRGTEAEEQRRKNLYKILLCTPAQEHPCLLHRRPYPQNMKMEIIISWVWTFNHQIISNRYRYYVCWLKSCV
ncbi:hypothetical protein [Nostoc commune]|uniref:hypothetical protein n=1 Tax=Nostoc commune TaxID=1178 RepID=UPI0018C5C859|nr:hypothetical protein [Nostoc commune]MBG1263567.1 hypothetical protein [Nostoc commune BAE]